MSCLPVQIVLTGYHQTYMGAYKMSEENKTVVTEEEMKSPTPEKLPDLKTLREKRGLKIEDIFLKTRINTAVLIAIENGEFHLLPAPLYAKKFIESYAKTIGIDAGTVLASYQRYLDEQQAVPEEMKGAEAPIASDRKPLQRFLLYAVLAVAIIAIAIIVISTSQQNNRGIQRNVTVNEQKEPVPTPVPVVKERPVENVPRIPPPPAGNNVPRTPQPPPVVNNAPQAPPPAIIPNETAQIPGKGQFTLLIEAREDTWLRITEDRKPSYQVTLKTGKKLNLTAREFFDIRVGNAAGVNITFQGKPLGSLGRKGEVVHLRLPQQ